MNRQNIIPSVTPPNDPALEAFEEHGYGEALRNIDLGIEDLGLYEAWKASRDGPLEIRESLYNQLLEDRWKQTAAAADGEDLAQMLGEMNIETGPVEDLIGLLKHMGIDP